MGVLDDLNRELSGQKKTAAVPKANAAGSVSAALQRELNKTTQKKETPAAPSVPSVKLPTYAELARQNEQRKANRQKNVEAQQKPAADNAQLFAGLNRLPGVGLPTTFEQQYAKVQSSPAAQSRITKYAADSLNAQIAAAQQEAQNAQKKLAGMQRAPVTKEMRENAQTAYEAAQEKLRALEGRRDALANKYYQAENETTLQKMQGNDTFRMARGLQEELDTVQSIIDQNSNMTQQERDAFLSGLESRYGTRNTLALAQTLIKELEPYKAQLQAQGVDFDRVAEYLRRQDRAQLQAEKREQRAEAAKEYPVLTSLQSVVASPAQGVDFLRMIGTGKGSSKDLGSYVPYDPNVMTVTDAVQTIRNTVGEEIEKKTNWEIAGQNVARFLYETGMSIGDSAVSIAAFPPAAIYVMGMSAAANQSKNIIERGGTNQQAFWGGLAAGAAEAFFEKFSVEKLLEPATKAGFKGFVEKTFQQMGVEASEEMATEISNIIADAAIMRERSEYNEAVRSYVAQGMTQEQAEQAAFIDMIGRVAMAGIGGALSGGVMGGSVGGYQSATNRAPGVKFDGFGEAGSKAMMENFDGSISAREYFEGFSAYYAAGVSNVSMNNVQGEGADKLPENLRKAAYRAGQQDAKQTFKTEKKEAQKAQTATESGLVQDEYTATLNEETVKRMDDLAKRLGVSARFVDQVRGGTANAQISGAEVLIEKNNPNPEMFLIGHELTHRMQELAPAEYRAFRDAIAVEVQGEASAMLNRYRAAGENITFEQALDEAAANYAGRLIQNTQDLDAFIEQHADNRNMLQKLLDAIRDLLAKLTGRERQMALTAEQRLVNALQGAEQQAQKMKNAPKTRSEGVQYDLKGNSFQEDKYFARQIDQWDELADGARIKVGTVFEGSALSRVGMPASGMFFDVGKIRKSMADHDDHLSPAVLKGIPDMLNDPIVIAEYKGPDGKVKNTVNVYGNLFVGNTPIVVGIVMRLDSNGRNIINNIRTVHARSNFAKQITDETVLYLNEDKKRTRKWFHDCGNLNVPLAGTQFGLIRSIAFEEENVKFSMKDSEGHDLTPEQQEYFKDSKIRVSEVDGWRNTITEDGKLFPVYHGTNSGEFYEFDERAIGSANDKGWYGRGFYFAFTAGEARYYGRKVMECYLNVTKPFFFSEELQEYDGQDTGDISAGFASFAINVAEKFPEIAQNVFVDVTEKTGETTRRTFAEIAKEVKEIYNSDRLKLQKIYDQDKIVYEFRYAADTESIEAPENIKELIRNKHIDSPWVIGRLLQYGDITTEEADAIYELFEKYGEEQFADVWIRRRFDSEEYANKHRLSAAMQYLSNYKYGYIEERSNSYYMTHVIGDAVTQEIRNRGYDGIIQSRYGDEIVVFEPEQIKLTSNKNPTKTADIRHSLKGSENALEDAEEQRNFIINQNLLAKQKGTKAAVPKAMAMIEAEEPVFRIMEETGLYQAEGGVLKNQFGMTVHDPAERDPEEELYAKLEREAIAEESEASIRDLQNAHKAATQPVPEGEQESEARKQIDAFVSGESDAIPGAEQTLTKKPTEKKGPVEAIKDSARFIYRKMVDSGEAVARVGKRIKDDVLYAYYNQARASGNAAVNMIVEAQTNVKGEKVGEALMDIFQPIIDKGADYHEAFQLYMWHKHNVNRMQLESQQAIEEARQAFEDFKLNHRELNLFDERTIENLARKDGSPYQAAAKQFVELRDRKQQAENRKNKPIFGFDYTAADSKAIADRLLRENPEFAELAERVYKYERNLMQYRIDSGLVTQQDADFWEGRYPFYVPTQRQTEPAEGRKNRKHARTGKTVKTAEGGTETLVPIHVALANQTRSVVREGTKNLFGQRLLAARDKLGDFAAEVTEAENGISEVDLDTRETVLDPSQDLNTFAIFKDGKTYTMKISKDLFEAVEALNPQPQEENIFYKAMQGTNNMFKLLITGYNPLFTVRNAIKDQQAVMINSRNYTEYAKNYPQAIKEIAENGPFWRTYKALGGTASTLLNYETDELNPPKGAGKVVSRIQAVNMAVEQAPRLAEFMAVVKNGDGSLDNLMEAMLASQDVTTNFGRSGSWGKWLNRNLVPFLNPSIQGTDKLIRTLGKSKTFKEWMLLAAKCAALGFAAPALNGLLYGDDEEWDKLKERDKNAYYLFKIGDGQWLKIPRGREFSAMAFAGAMFKNIANGEQVNVLDYLREIYNQVGPTNPLENNILAGWTDAKLFDSTNPGETWYGGDIESQRLQGYKPGDRYDEKTDVVSKWIGKQLNLSPKKINYIIDQYSGVVGDVMLPLLSPQAERDMFTAAFTIDSVRTNRFSEEFYSTGDQLEYAKNDPEATGYDQIVMKYWNKQNSLVSEINADIREVEAAAGMSDKEKKEATRDLMAVRNATQAAALENLEKYQEAAQRAYDAAEGDEEDRVDVAYREANREIFGAEYALKVYNKDVYAKAQEAAEAGLAWDTFYDYYFAAKGKNKKAEKREVINAMDISEEEKQILFESSVASESDLKNIAELEAANFTEETALDIAFRMDALEPAKGKKEVSDQQRFTAISGMDMTEEEKLAAIRVYDSTEGANVYQQYAEAVDAGFDVDEYNEYREQASGITSDKDANGKTISGSKKEKVVKLIHSQNVTDEMKDFLFLQDYAESGLDETPWHNYAGDLPTAANGFRGLYRIQKSGTIRGKNTLRGKNNLR